MFVKGDRYVRGCMLPQRYVLVIAEKPKAASRIAEALSDSIRPRVCRYGRIPFWLVYWHGKPYVIAAAAGHLFGLTTDEKGFPVFTYYWAPLWEIDEASRHTKAFFNVIEYLSKRAYLFINACDYDIEGSVIGYTILKAIGGLERARRARYSALTRSDIRRAFENLTPLDWDMINAGLARHELDWIWGINISRALMEAVKAVTGKKIILSAGRVQSPTLLEAVKRSMMRRLYVPIPKFEARAIIELDGMKREIILCRCDSRDKARDVAKLARSQGVLRVLHASKKVENIMPPYPFNLGDLQAEAARIYGFSPYYTQKLAEDLYLEGLISYPRTNSQRIPGTINLKSIVEKIAQQPRYAGLVKMLLNKTRGLLKVNNGPKTDPAHPAIYPTGERPSKLDKPHARLYDLIVRRFLASMMPPAKLVKINLVIGLDLTSEIKVRLSGLKILEPSWMDIYYWLKPREEPLPLLSVGQSVKIRRTSVITVFPPPPKPHTKASLVKWMEAKGIGTEATRARIVELLFERKYLTNIGGYVYSTELGEAVAEVLSKFFPKIVSIELTREFEEKLEAIRMGRLSRSEVIEEAKRLIGKLLTEFKEKHLHEAGATIAYSLKIVEPKIKCPICGRPSKSLFCKYHEQALEALKQGYKEWQRRLQISCREFLEKIAKLKFTGNLVRDVALYILARPELINHVCK
jgi:DNA topoisomerase-1